jgi:hypothetical protein
MENGPKIAIASTVVLLLAVGIRVGLIYKANHEDAPAPAKATVKVDPDYNVFLKKQRPDSPKDERALIGKTVWVAAGGQMSYLPSTHSHADYEHPAGILLGTTPLLIDGVFEQVAPKNVPFMMRIPAGDKQVLLSFTMPKSADPKTEYAIPVGTYDAGTYTFYSDDILYYDDPRTLYAFWGPEVWAHIDKHEAVPGMTENQCTMALGQVTNPHGDTPGNRSITYDNDSHPVTITFENGKATKITPGA